MNRTGILILIVCSASKVENYLGPARELYTGDLYRLARRYADNVGLGVSWGILSAKYGVLGPACSVQTYEETLDTAEKRRKWNELVLQQLQDPTYPTPAHTLLPPAPEPARILVFAGEHYRGWIENAPEHWTVEVPLQGLGIGEQKAVLGRMNDSLNYTKHHHYGYTLEERIAHSLTTIPHPESTTT